MRKTLIAVLFILVSLSLSAQSIVDSANVWSNLILRLPSFSITTETLQIEGDTVIDDLIYGKVMRSQDEFQSSWEPYGYIRETAAKRVFYRTDSTSDVLLYDFMLNEGDVVEVYGVTGYGSFETVSSTEFQVAIKDSVFIGDVMRARLQLVPVLETDTLEDISDVWIEGIGSKSGLLHWEACLCGGNAYELLCFSHDDNLLFQNQDYSTCYYVYSSSEVLELEGLSVYPNPARDWIQVDGLEIQKLRLRNLTGQLLMESDGAGKVDVSQFPAGVYILELKSAESKMHQKIVIE